MTNKYSKLSDYEINVLIIDTKEPNNRYHFNNYPDQSTACYWTGDGSNGPDYADFCYSYQDAFRLMIDNKINLIKGKNAWFAEDGERLSAVNVNPCRAIAECFLLIKDTEKTDDHQLKPCPFCGGEPNVNRIEPHQHEHATFMPDCSESYTIECFTCEVGMISDSWDDVEKRWNKRSKDNG
ncbi:Lar family restriction alleviation protein [Utexia brackfieldae]|uniref:Lar family restriction alleviation protein n=1 Tax=Utexia brackfieldae TaxID=3074108 RepID=UPI00370DD863